MILWSLVVSFTSFPHVTVQYYLTHVKKIYLVQAVKEVQMAKDAFTQICSWMLNAKPVAIIMSHGHIHHFTAAVIRVWNFYKGIILTLYCMFL
jgi:hypothetical protein